MLKKASALRFVRGDTGAPARRKAAEERGSKENDIFRLSDDTTPCLVSALPVIAVCERDWGFSGHAGVLTLYLLSQRLTRAHRGTE